MFDDFTKTRIAANGVSINLVYGGSDPPLLLMHGNPQTHVEWHKVAPELAKHYTVVAPDLRGYGDSEKPADPDEDMNVYSFCTMAQDQLEVMAKPEFTSFHFVGHDRGVRVGHRMALDHPESVRSLTSLDVVPSQAAWDKMDGQLAFAWFHWPFWRASRPPFPRRSSATAQSSSWTSCWSVGTPPRGPLQKRRTPSMCGPSTTPITFADGLRITVRLSST